MKPKNPNITADRLRQILSYEPETGLFRWVKGGHGVFSGAVAGSTGDNGYMQIRIAGRNCYAHRLAWLHVYGSWPSSQIDHINGVRLDNRIANLRQATCSENAQNRVVHRKSKSGVPGVNWNSRQKKWRAEIRSGGVTTHLGFFSSVEDAIAARTKAKAEIHKFQPFDREVSHG